VNELIQQLMTFAPLIGQMTGHGEAVQLTTRLVAIAAAEADRIAAQRGQTREQVLLDAQATWDEAIKGAEDLKKWGHEGEK
jgi:hypothetical protein